MTDIRTLTRCGKALATAAVVLAASVACDGALLDVDDPDNIRPPEQLSPGSLPTEFGGLVGDFREALDTYVLYSGLLTDEFVLGGTFPTREQIDNRDPLTSNGTIHDDVWRVMARAVLEADALVSNLEAVQGDPEFDQALVAERLAQSRLIAGYQRVYFAELFCQSIFGGDLPDAESAPLTSDERMQEAANMLSQAASDAAAAGLTTEENAALVGQARALMWLGQYQQAANLVGGVPTDFEWQVEYSANTTNEENEVFGFNWGVTFNLRWTIGNGTDPGRGLEEFAYFDEWVDQGLIFPDSDPDNDLEAFGAPNRPVSAPTIYGSRAGIVRSNPINVATGWEARMIEAEALLRAGSPGAAQTLVNDLLDDPEQLQNPILAVEPSLNEPPSGADLADGELGAFDPVTFGDEPLAGDLEDLARARAAGMWLSGTRQGYFRRLHPKSGGPVDLYPDRQGDAVSLPLIDQEVDNNPNVSSFCPQGLP